MNPDTLREVAACGGSWLEVLAHADAWEADRQRLEAARRAWREGNYPGLEDALAAGDEFPCETEEYKNACAEPTISDGFGNTWAATCECGGKMQVVRPGVVQCSECG